MPTTKKGKGYSASEKLVTSTERQQQFTNAVNLYHKNNDLFIGLRALRSKQFKSLRNSVEQIKKANPKATMSVANLMNWKKQFPHLIKNNNLFREFMEKVGIDADEIKRKDSLVRHNKSDIKRRKTQKEKDTKLKEEMKKATLILSEMNQENLSDTKKWELHDMGRRQLDKINKEIQTGGVPKTDGVTALYDINGKLLAKGKEIILTNLSTIDVKHFGDLKALSDILDTAFKQNRLISGQSTDNVAVGVHEIYDTIIANQDKLKDVNTDTNNYTQENKTGL